MRSIRKKIRSVAVGACVPFALACREPTPAPLALAGNATPVRGGELHLASAYDIKSLDPAVSSDALTAEVIELVYAGLVDFDEAGHVIPDLAERFERSDDGMTYRFFLREGIKFHDGSAITAADCKRSIERALNPDTPNSFSEFYDRIVGFEEYNTNKTADHLEGVTVEGERVLAVRLREPDATFLPRFALQVLRPVCPSAGTKYDDAWTPCGAGPFKLDSVGSRPQRAPRALRWMARARHAALRRAHVHVLDEPRHAALQARARRSRSRSRADRRRFISLPGRSALGAARRLRHDSERRRRRACNVEMPPFDNIEVRRAVAAAIDRDQFRMVKTSALVPLTRVLVPVLGGDDPNFPAQKYDYKAALEHMRRAGYPYDPKTGVGGWPKTIVYPIYKQGLYELSSQVIQQQLAKIGIRIEIKTVSYPTYLMMEKRRGAVAIGPVGWSQDFPDASDFFEPIFSTSAINDEDSNNGAFYSNPKLDDMLVRGRKELDPAVRKKIYDEADALVCDEAPWVMEYQYRYYGVHQPYVKDLRWSAAWPNYVRDVWLDKAPKKVASMTRERSVLGSLVEIFR